LTIAFAKTKSPARVATSCLALLISLSACGDSSGPSKLDSSAALQSLALGMGALVAVETPGVAPNVTDFGELAPLLDQIDVTIDGSSQPMFALGLRETFPAGTCIENVFINPAFPPVSGECTSPELGLAVLLWESHSASAPPDRLIFLIADVGTTNFDFASNFYSISDPAPVPGMAIYMENVGDTWLSLSGTLTSQIAATAQACGLPLPPYAKSGTCSIATFDEQGSITFEEFSETGPSTRHRVVTIPRQTMHGLWQSITETQPINVSGPWDYNRVSGWPGLLQLNKMSGASHSGSAINSAR
jgi:hypothetical protein